MVKFHSTLSERSVYLRYFCSLSLSIRVEHERLVWICFGAYDRGFALVADRKISETGQRRSHRWPSRRFSSADGFYFMQEPTPLVVRRLGWSELKHATASRVLLIATFILAR